MCSSARVLFITRDCFTTLNTIIGLITRHATDKSVDSVEKRLTDMGAEQLYYVNQLDKGTEVCIYTQTGYPHAHAHVHLPRTARLRAPTTFLTQHSPNRD